MNISADEPGTPHTSADAGKRFTQADADRLARTYFDAYNSRDLEALLAVLAEDVVIHPSPLFQPRRGYEGSAGAREWMHATLAATRRYEQVVTEVRLVNRDQWAVLGEIRLDGELVAPLG